MRQYFLDLVSLGWIGFGISITKAAVYRYGAGAPAPGGDYAPTYHILGF